MKAETEFCDGGIDLVIEKEFASKLVEMAKLNDQEMLAITECVMGNMPKSHLAKEMGVTSSRVNQIINKSKRKIKKIFYADKDKLIGSKQTIAIEKTIYIPSWQRIEIEKKKEAEERIVVDTYGATHWYRGNLLHRDGAPATLQANGGQAWFYYGIRHREDGPAIEYADGSTEWWLLGQRHRQVGYAVEYSNGKREKWLYGNKIYEEKIPITIFK